MCTTLRVLLLEDSDRDAERVLAALRRGGFDPIVGRVTASTPLEAIHDQSSWDVGIFGDTGHTLEGIVNCLSERGLDLPMVVVSKAHGEEAAAAAVRAGAPDFIPKRHLARLSPAVRREMELVAGPTQREPAARPHEVRPVADFLRQSPAVLFRVSLADARFTHVSDNAERILGRWARQLLGRSAHRLVWLHPEDRRRVRHVVRQALAGGALELQLECRLRRGDGYSWVLGTLQVERDPAGAPVGLVGHVLDITSRKHAELALRQHEALQAMVLRHVPVAFYVARPDGRGATWVSDNIQDITGFPPRVFIEDPRFWASRIHPADREAMSSRFGRRRPTSVVVDEFRWQHADGSWRWILDHTMVVADGEGTPVEIMGSWLDITERRASEERQKAAREAAERASQSKSEFISGMSHELRTLLQVVLGYTQILEMGTPRPDQMDGIRRISQACHHVVELVNEALDISRIEAGRLSLDLEPVSLSTAVDESLALLAPLAMQRGIRIECSIASDRPTYVRADRQRFKQILLNLVSNAIKHNHPDGVAAVSAAVREGRVRITVADTGPGIPADRLGRLFVPFERLGASQRGIDGIGLGLALSKGLAEAMGGTIGVQTEVGRGSTFWVELPETDAPPSQTGSQVEGEASDERADDGGGVIRSAPVVL